MYFLGCRVAFVLECLACMSVSLVSAKTIGTAGGQHGLGEGGRQPNQHCAANHLYLNNHKLLSILLYGADILIYLCILILSFNNSRFVLYLH